MPEASAMNIPLFKISEDTPGRPVTFEFERRKITTPAGTSIAAALLTNGCGPFRSTPVNATPRSAFCMMGVCFDCLVEIDGISNRQACQIIVQDGMKVRMQNGAPLLQPMEESRENE